MTHPDEKTRLSGSGRQSVVIGLLVLHLRNIFGTPTCSKPPPRRLPCESCYLGSVKYCFNACVPPMKRPLRPVVFRGNKYERLSFAWRVQRSISYIFPAAKWNGPCHPLKRQRPGTRDSHPDASVARAGSRLRPVGARRPY